MFEWVIVMSYWWWWLSQNSAAVQGIAAVLQVLAALLIFGITWRYVHLTRDLVRATENQGRLSESLLAATQRQTELQSKATRIALYDRHLKIYKAVMWFLNEFHPHMQLEMPNLFKFRRLTMEAKFLLQAPALKFTSDLESHVLEHWRIKQELESWRMQKERGDPVEDYQKLMDQMHAMEHWLVKEAFQLADEHFRPYLGFTASELQTAV